MIKVVNDVSGLRFDADSKASYALLRSRGHVSFHFASATGIVSPKLYDIYTYVHPCQQEFMIVNAIQVS